MDDELFCFPCFHERELLSMALTTCDVCSSHDLFHPSDLDPTDLQFFNELLEQTHDNLRFH